MKLFPSKLICAVVLAAAGFELPPAGAATQVGSAPYKASSTGAGNSYAPVFSADGKHVAFVSHANNLVTNDDLAPHLDLFVRDLAASNTVLVSVSTNGLGGANDNIGLYTLSSNAQVIAFETLANNLAPDDTNRWRDIYVRDLMSGVTRLITPGANGPSSNPLVSEDGQRVIFESLASNLVTNDFNGTNDIFIHDLTTGVTELVTWNAAGTASPDGPSHSPSTSADGLVVAFISRATNLVENLIHARPEVYARDIIRRVNTRAAADININRASGTYSSDYPYSPNSLKLSKSGRYASFQTAGLFIRFDFLRPTNFVTTYSNTTPPNVALVYYSFADNPRLVSGAEGTRHGQSVIGNDSRFMVHETRGNWFGHRGLVHTDLETMQSITYEIDPWGCCGLVTKTIPLLSVVLSNASFFPQTWSNMNLRKITHDGSRVFYVRDSAIVTNGIMTWLNDFYVLDTSNRVERFLLSYTDIGDAPPAITEDGKYIAWDSVNSSIVSDDLNRASDVFVRNVGTGETQLISARHPDSPAASGLALSRLDLNPGAISANGRRLAILSLDNTLVPDDTNRWRDLIVRDFAAGMNIDVSRSTAQVGISPHASFPGTNAAASPFLSADGRQIAFAAETMQLGQTSPFGTNSIIYRRDLSSSSNRVVVSGGPFSRPVLSPDGRFVAFHSASSHESGYYSDVNSQNDVYVFGSRIVSVSGSIMDCALDPSVLPSRFVSSAWQGNKTANGPSINPAFSPDSNWLLFESLATDLLEHPIPATPGYQLYARSFVITNRLALGCVGRVDVLDYSPTRLISYAVLDSADPARAGSEVPLPGGGTNPRFSGDTRYVAFESSTNLILRHDFQGEWMATAGESAGVFFTNYARPENLLVCTNCANASLNLDGRFVAYESRPSPGGVTNIFLKDLNSGSVELVSVSLTGTNGNGSSFSPLLSQDARFVVFASRASDLVPGDSNRVTDIFVRDRWAGVTHCLSRNLAGTGTGNRVSSNPILSADGRTVAFQSFASDLVAGDYNDTRDVFVVTLGGPDNDGDGMEDDWEVAYFNTLARDGSGDFDNDGASDRDEFRAGTSPANDASILRVLRLTTGVAEGNAAARTTVILWQAIPGRTYRVEVRENLNSQWEQVGADIVAATTAASVSHAQDASAEANPQKSFYRVVLVQ